MIPKTDRVRPQILQAPNLVRYNWLIHGFSTRAGGVSRLPGVITSSNSSAELNLGMDAWDSPGNVTENRRRFQSALQAEHMDLVTLNQIHSDLIRTADRHDEPVNGLRGDGLTTRGSGLLLSIQSADCLPVLLADIRRRAVAALHCGWRGTVKRMAQKGVGLLRQKYGSRVEDLRVAVGPGIRVCCYEVREDLVEQFRSQFIHAMDLFTSPSERERPFAERHTLMHDNSIKYPLLEKEKKYHLDLVKANVEQLRETGIAATHIWHDAPCTHCHPEMLYSHRRDPGRAGRMLGAIGIGRATG